MNSVKLYSNGTAVISREFAFHDQQPQRISIPVRKTDLDDVISSLSVFGAVTITEPPTYTPTNAQETTLTLNPASVLKDMATKLAGAQVEIEAGSSYQGKLLGLHPYRREVNDTVLDESRLMILTEKGVQQVEEASVTAIRFTDSVVQAEIDKALRSSLSQVKPDSSMVEMTVQSKSGTTNALVTYATPVAAWKIRYQLRISPQETELEGQAVVDNDTDDDWTDTLITVITGEPITFATDLAETCRPARSRVNIVADHATGAVIAEPEGAYVGGGVNALPQDSRSVAYHMPDRIEFQKASQVQAEVRESGDFSIFTSPNPVTVGAKRSAIIPLFRTAVSDAKAILFYRGQDDPQRPFRAIRLTNTASHSLGRGICEVYEDGDFQGKCVLEPTQVGDDALLVYAKEIGVRIFKKRSRPESRRMAIRISAGTVYYEKLKRQVTTYRIQSSQPDTFTLEIEHPHDFRDSKLSIVVSSGEHEAIDIPSGQKIRVTLPPRGRLSVTVKEEEILTGDFVLDASWFHDNVIGLESPHGRDAGIEKCVKLQSQIHSLSVELDEQESAAETIAQEQERLMKLIPNGHGEQATAWRTDLADAEKELREIKRSNIPTIKTRLREAESSLHEAFRSLQYEWKDESRPESQE